MSPLRRTGDWGRNKPLSSSKPLSRGTGLSRSTPLPRTPVQKGVETPRRSRPLSSARPKVTPEERLGRRLLRARSQGRCEIGNGCPAQEAHHRQNRSQGGSWDVTNLLHLCHAHHQHVGTHPAAARQQGWAVLSTDDPAAVPVWLAGRGFTYLTADGGTRPSTEGVAA